MSQSDSDSEKKGPDERGERKLSVMQIRKAAQIAAQGLRLRKSPEEIIAKIRQMGLTHREAEGIEDHARLAYQHSQLRIWTMLMVSGFLWAIAAFVVPVLLASPNAQRYSWMIFTAALLQWLYGWQRRRQALRIRAIRRR